MSTVLLLALTVSVITYIAWARLSRHRVRLPPGPSRLPFVGSVHHLPLEYQHKKFVELAKTFGDVIFLQLFSRPTVVLNSLDAASDLLEKRSSKYSDRPRFILTAMMGFDLAMSIMPYGEQWRRHRRWFAAAFVDKKLESYVPIQQRETHRLLVGLLESPDAFLALIKRYVGALMMEVAYGHEVTSLDDEIVVLAEKAVGAATEAGSPAATLIDFVPILQWIPAWLPGGRWKMRAAEVRQMVRRTSDVPFARVQAAIAAGTARPCFLWSLLEEEGETSEEELEEIKAAANLVYGAGTDTTATVLNAFVLAMVLHPDACKKAQEEIDRVIGDARLPDFGDRASLPYVEALFKEVYRWIPPVPLGLPHRLTEDDSYRCYTIPEGSMMIPNVWGMTRNADIYLDPETFRPERFLEMDAATAAAADPRNMAFGFGRRICPGKEFADGSVWLAAANVLAAFDIRKARDAAGREVTPVPAFASGMISHVRPFACDIRPRSLKAARMIGQLQVDGGA
ncbi:cytochrome P450 [Fomitopsis serialis]|uniref:cytochrome P450 n=1 Tax=Fomitopsis serialis TaxID=139415 RepID=UPI002008C12F|nr:cytochrome P450 [Neoantrodia serialis]KAH9916791.1 cytochrome P450 [Neoantrodia serialis]